MDYPNVCRSCGNDKDFYVSLWFTDRKEDQKVTCAICESQNIANDVSPLVLEAIMLIKKIAIGKLGYSRNYLTFIIQDLLTFHSLQGKVGVINRMFDSGLETSAQKKIRHHMYGILIDAGIL